MSDSEMLPWAVWQRRAATAGAAGLVVWIIGALFFHGPAFQAYWFAWLFWTGVGCGAFVLCCLQFVTRGAWSLAVQRPLEAGMMTLPVMALLIIPGLIAARDIFPWASADLFEHAPHKRAWLTVPWLAVRAAIFFGFLVPLALRLRQWSAREDEGQTRPNPADRAHFIGSGGLVVYSVGTLMVSTDWIMSLEPRWYSTMFGVIIGISQLLTALAGAVAFVILAPDKAGYKKLFDTKLLRDLGNLLMAFVVFWTYVSFSQFLIIYSGNLPAEISWYLHRSTPGWQALVAVLALLQFGLPFALLLSRATKARPRRLAGVAILVFFMNALNIFWLVVPSFGNTTLLLAGLCIAAFVGLGGAWAAIFLWAFEHGPLPRVAMERKEVAHG